MKNPLSKGLIEVARALLQVPGDRATKQAALRRAISSAYYAVFHALCRLSGDGLNLWTTGGDDLQIVYRSLDHGRAGNVLTAAATRALHPDLVRIGDVFVELRSLREDADYSQPGRLGGTDKLLTRHETEILIEAAVEAIAQIDGLPPPVRRRLAVLFLTGLNKRPASLRRP